MTSFTKGGSFGHRAIASTLALSVPDPGDRDRLPTDLVDRGDARTGHDLPDGLVEEAGDHDEVLSAGLRAHDRGPGHGRDPDVPVDERGHRGARAVDVAEVEIDA